MRRAHHRSSEPSFSTFEPAVTLQASDAPFAQLTKVIATYRESPYAALQEGIEADSQEVMRLVDLAAVDEELIVKCNALTRAITFAQPARLESLLRFSVLPTFFAFDGNGAVQPFLVAHATEKMLAFVRAAYGFDHYPMAEIRSAEVGFATLTSWDRAFAVDFIETWISIVQVAAYPNISLFFGGPFGMPIVFYFSVQPKHTPHLFPSTWLQWARQDALFADQARNRSAILAGTDALETRHLVHRRHFTEPLELSSVQSLLNWGVIRLSALTFELSDVSQFVDAEGYIDLTFPLEHALSFMRILRRALYAVTTEEMPEGKFAAFDVADLLDGVADAFGTRKATETFKLLFDPVAGRETIQAALTNLPDDIRRPLQVVVDDVYDDLKRTVLDSIWLPHKRVGDTVLVKSRDLRTEMAEGIGTLASNVVRALRNTHHGYFTRTDPQNRPSRYLSLVTGNIPDSVATLPMLWVIAFLADPRAVTGWSVSGA
jgi:hypothetical protein